METFTEITPEQAFELVAIFVMLAVIPIATLKMRFI